MKVNVIELISAMGDSAQINGFEVDPQDIEIIGNNPTVTTLKESLSTIILQPNLGNIKVLSPPVDGGLGMWEFRRVHDELMADATYGFINLVQHNVRHSQPQNENGIPDNFARMLQQQKEREQQQEDTFELSNATLGAKDKLLQKLSLSEKGASWPNKSYVPQRVEIFTWLNSQEDSRENRDAYMNYLRDFLQLPQRHLLADVKQNMTLLSVKWEGVVKISGTTDVIIAKKEDVENKAIRNNIEILIELKKPSNLGGPKDHTPQTVGEHFAASYLNSDHPVVSVLTDLNNSWTFFWFASTEDNLGVALYKMLLDSNNAACEAKYIMDSFFNETSGDTLPTTFVNRLSLQAVIKCVDKNTKKRPRSEFDDDSSPDQDSKHSPSGDLDQDSTNEADATSSRSGDTSHQNNQGDSGGSVNASMSMARMLSLFAPPCERDVANELDLLDMVDESEQYEIVRSFALKHIVPYMKG